MHSSALSQLADRYGSDKGAVHGDRHRYAQIYDLLFSPLRKQFEQVVEIGLARGRHELSPATIVPGEASPSIRMWLDFFPNAQITGIDHADFGFMRDLSPRFRFLRADAGDESSLRQLAGELGRGVDLLIDDASHASYHQQLALRELAGCVRSGGYYVIEDLHWQPVHLETSLPLVHRTADWIELFRQDRAPASTIWGTSDIEVLRQRVDCCAVFRDTQVPGGRFISALAVLRMK